MAVGLPSAHPAVQPFFSRASCITTAGIHTLLLGAVEDPGVSELPPGLGSIEQCGATTLTCFPGPCDGPPPRAFIAYWSRAGNVGGNTDLLPAEGAVPLPGPERCSGTP